MVTYEIVQKPRIVKGYIFENKEDFLYNFSGVFSEIGCELFDHAKEMVVENEFGEFEVDLKINFYYKNGKLERGEF